MSDQMQINTPNNIGTPLYNYPESATLVTPQGQSVSVNPNYTMPIYQYPSSSIYGQNKQMASGVNIVICNPSGYSNGNNCTVPYYPVIPAVQQPTQIINNIPEQPAPVINNNIPQAEQPLANTPIQPTAEENEKSTKKKRITEITDDYVKNLENYLRNADKTTRTTAITQLIKLLEEDQSRYEDPALTALLNIALQDSDASNRVYAMIPITTGSIHGDENTKQILEKLVNSTKLQGKEASTAREALLMLSRTVKEVPDYSDKKK